jgi:ribosomal protein L23
MILTKTRRLQNNSNKLSMIVREKAKPDQIYTLIDKAYYVDQIKFKIDI